ncbi:hypothetical protein [Novosphingobium rosa]|uniref:hypothetical protein n=1 Tax=Novosphingobium rosa TaxID=76978 RepID=UPI000AAA8788|nr:hypothetical protein [Novosphingobium rosa]
MLDSVSAVACVVLAVVMSGMSNGGFAGVGALSKPGMVGRAVEVCWPVLSTGSTA